MNNFFFLFIFLVFQLNFGQTKVWINPKSNHSIATVQWEVNDLVYSVKGKVEKPFIEEAFAIVKGRKEEQRIPLFYNGNNEWVFRFSSASIGTKTFVIESDIKELNGKKGSFTIQENKKEDRHGGIVLHKDNPQHFFYEDGSHYFNLAFECDWLFALDYGQNEILKTKQLLTTIADNKFNQIVMNVYSYVVSCPKDK